MTANQKVGVEIGKVPFPIYVALGTGRLPERPAGINSKNKELLHHLRPIQAALEAIFDESSVEKNGRGPLQGLHRHLVQTIGTLNQGINAKNKNEFSEEMDTLRKALKPKATIKQLTEIQQSLISAITTPEKNNTSDFSEFIESMEGKVALINTRILQHLDTSQKLYPSAVTEAHRLRYKIDRLAMQPRPPKEHQDNLVFRCNGALSENFVNETLDLTDAKNASREQRFEALTQEWNDLSVQMLEIMHLKEIIDILLPLAKDFAPFRKKLDGVIANIKTMLKDYENIEGRILGRTSDLKTHRPYTGTFAELFKDLEGFSKSSQELGPTDVAFQELLELITPLNAKVTTALTDLEKASRKDFLSSSSSEYLKYQSQITALYLAPGNKSARLFEDLKTQIVAAHQKLQMDQQKAAIGVPFLSHTLELSKNLATLSLKYHEQATTLRDLRKTPMKRSVYQASRLEEVNKWNQLVVDTKELVSKFNKIEQLYGSYVRQLDDHSERKEPKAQDMKKPRSMSLKGDEARELQEQLKIHLERLKMHWTEKLPAISEIVVRELNRGADALKQDGYDDDFSQAFTSELSYRLSDTTRSLTALVNWNPSQAAQPPVDAHYQSPFGSLTL